jgi:hypothetical protein
MQDGRHSLCLNEEVSIDGRAKKGKPDQIRLAAKIMLRREISSVVSFADRKAAS